MVKSFKDFKLKIVDAIDYSLDDQGRYKEEYRNAIVVTTTGEDFIIVDDGGNCFMAVSQVGLNIAINFRELFEIAFNSLESTKSSENDSQFNFSDVEKLLKLRERFSVDEIVKLKEAKLI